MRRPARRLARRLAHRLAHHPSRGPLLGALVLLAAAACGAGAAAAPRPQAPACAAPRGFEPADRAAIAAVLDAQVAAWNRGDLAAYMEGYARTDALVFTSGGKIRRGWQRTFDQYRSRYADRAAMGQLVFRVESIDPVGADGAVALGAWILTGSQHDARGVFSVVFERRPEGWRAVHDHTSVGAE